MAKRNWNYQSNNCGVVGCYGTNEQGQSTLNGKVLPMKYQPIGGSDLDLIMIEKSKKDAESQKVLKQYLIYGVIAVGGYFVYKQFKK